jgi:hypothetical protein
MTVQSSIAYGIQLQSTAELCRESSHTISETVLLYTTSIPFFGARIRPGPYTERSLAQVTANKRAEERKLARGGTMGDRSRNAHACIDVSSPVMSPVLNRVAPRATAAQSSARVRAQRHRCLAEWANEVLLSHEPLVDAVVMELVLARK